MSPFVVGPSASWTSPDSFNRHCLHPRHCIPQRQEQDLLLDANNNVVKPIINPKVPEAFCSTDSTAIYRGPSWNVQVTNQEWLCPFWRLSTFRLRSLVNSDRLQSLRPLQRPLLTNMSITLSEEQETLLKTSYPESFNFHSEYSVVIDHPISTVFPVLGHGHQAERMVRLSDLCTDFQLFDKDLVVTPNSAPLIESRVRTASSSTSSEGLPRQYLRLQETVSLIFGLNVKVEIVGTQTWDEDAKMALYETVTDQGIMVWKVRVFKEIEDDGKKKTSVMETINGSCPWWMKLIVQRETSKAHRCV